MIIESSPSSSSSSPSLLQYLCSHTALLFRLVCRFVSSTSQVVSDRSPSLPAFHVWTFFFDIDSGCRRLEEFRQVPAAAAPLLLLLLRFSGSNANLLCDGDGREIVKQSWLKSLETCFSYFLALCLSWDCHYWLAASSVPTYVDIYISPLMSCVYLNRVGWRLEGEKKNRERSLLNSFSFAWLAAGRSRSWAVNIGPTTVAERTRSWADGLVPPGWFICTLPSSLDTHKKSKMYKFPRLKKERQRVFRYLPEIRRYYGGGGGSTSYFLYRLCVDSERESI